MTNTGNFITRARAGLASAMAILVVAACTTDTDNRTAEAEGDTTARSAAPVVLVSADEYSFSMPDTITGGLTTFRLTDAGAEPHHLMMVRLDDGHTAEELMGAMSSPTAPLPEWAVFVGGPNSPAPGSTESTEVALELQPGNYVALCMVPSPDGVPHAAKGMVRPFVVVAPDEEAAEPEADIEMSLVDYDYALSTPITAGRRVIKVVNDAQQHHEVLFVRLDEGKTMEDVMAWEKNPQGPMPATPLGGTAPMSPGVVNYVTAEFRPGTYAMICFVPDATDGRPHTEHGMVKMFTVD